MRAEPGEREAAALATDWAAGMWLPAEQYRFDRPDLLDPPDGAIRLVFEELCLRLERGEELSDEELRRRFPRWASELAVMLDCQRMLDDGLPRFPKAGESLGGFQLVREIG